MDLVLSIADDLVLDKLWAKLVPLEAFAASPELLASANATASFLPLAAAASKWTQFVTYLPHPPLQAAAAKTVANVSAWPREYIPRQLLSLVLITMIGIHLLYFLIAGFSYYVIFNHEMMKHPRFLKNQVKLEIQKSMSSFPGMMLLTVPWFQAEVMGYSKMYDGLDTYGYTYLALSVPL
jgi:lathosterol oxidase